MLTRLVAFAACVVPLYVLGADSFDIKAGAWDVTMSTSFAGMPVPQEALAKMPPDQRAKIEAMIQARAGKVQTHTYRTCVTAEDLDRNALMKSESPGCKRNVITKTASVLELEETCGAPEPSQTHATFQASSPAAYTANVVRTMGKGGEVHIDMKGKWIAAACSKGDD